MIETYIGDGVYATYDPGTGDVTLDLRAQPAVVPITRIVLESNTLDTFLAWVKAVRS